MELLAESVLAILMATNDINIYEEKCHVSIKIDNE